MEICRVATFSHVLFLAIVAQYESHSVSSSHDESSGSVFDTNLAYINNTSSKTHHPFGSHQIAFMM